MAVCFNMIYVAETFTMAECLEHGLIVSTIIQLVVYTKNTKHKLNSSTL